VLGACNDDDSTNIAGTYTGNATYTASAAGDTTPALAGAEAQVVTIADASDDGASIVLAATCTLAAERLREEEIKDATKAQRFVFTSETIAPSGACTLPVVGTSVMLRVIDGELVVDHGGTLTLSFGGNATLADGTAAYLVFDFAGAS
jgi:hypothetical protein